MTILSLSNRIQYIIIQLLTRIIPSAQRSKLTSVRICLNPMFLVFIVLVSASPHGPNPKVDPSSVQVSSFLSGNYNPDYRIFAVHVEFCKGRRKRQVFKRSHCQGQAQLSQEIVRSQRRRLCRDILYRRPRSCNRSRRRPREHKTS